MSKLEHINLVVSDIEPALTFLMAAFPHWQIRTEGRDEWHGHPRRWLHVGDDETYVTLNDFGVGPQRDLSSNQPGLAHIGFEVPSLDEVKENLARAGFEPSDNGRDHPFRKNVYYIDAEGLEWEFVEYLSSDPARRNLDG